MKIFDIAGPAATAWIVAAATIAVLALVPAPTPSDDTRVARPPLADVTLAAPALRGDPSEGVDDMIFVVDGRGEEDRYGYSIRTELEPDS